MVSVKTDVQLLVKSAVCSHCKNAGLAELGDYSEGSDRDLRSSSPLF